MTSESTSDGTAAGTGRDAATRSPVSRARRVAGRGPRPAPAPTASAPTASAPTAPAPTASAPTAPAPTASAPTAPAPTASAPTAGPKQDAKPKTQRVSPARAAAAARRSSPSSSASRAVEVLDPPDAAPDGSHSKAGRNLPAAIGVGLGLGGLIIASLFLWRPAFAVVAGVAVLYGCYELSKALATGGIRITLLPLLVGSAAMLVAAWERGPSGLVLAALVTVLGVVVWRLGDGADGYGRDIGASALVVLYLPLLAGFAVLLSHPHDGAARVLAFVVTVVCSDTGGYATGVLFGKHPLAPIVSKGKTWEGFAGSVLACSGAGVLFMVFTFHHEWWKGLLFGLAVVVTATLGDLGESMIKRDVGIKDMGSLLPGHGGVMDRLDSLLPCAAVAYLLLSGFAPV